MVHRGHRGEEEECWKREIRGAMDAEVERGRMLEEEDGDKRGDGHRGGERKDVGIRGR